MSQQSSPISRLLTAMVDTLDIPESYYEKAANRYKSLGAWLHRADSEVRDLSPQVYLQGSFRYGTVIKPLSSEEEFDLDMACEVRLPKHQKSQKEVKDLLGREVKAYARAQSFKADPEPKHRCWRLNYADEVGFHLDIVPCVPEDPAFIANLIRSGIPPQLAESSVAITDDRLGNFAMVDPNWNSSNPDGYATWFEDKMRAIAKPRMVELAALRKVASIDEVPAYDWKTPLQQAIQILKRHRDFMYKDAPDLKPISVVITTLAALSYKGEADLGAALANIIANMKDHIFPRSPRVPNPLNPAEDFADKWNQNPNLHKEFLNWHTQVKLDFANLGNFLGDEKQLTATLQAAFGLPMSDAIRACLTTNQGVQDGGGKHSASPAIHLTSAPRPWGTRR